MPKRIAIVEDEAELAALIDYNLARHGYEPLVLSGSRDTLKALEHARPDLILLDVMLPEMDGFELCRQIRQSAVLSRTPVVFLTARSDEVDRVLGLEIGGDDYVVKPFSPRELVARAKAVMRRQERAAETRELVEAGDLRLDSRTQEVLVNGRRVELSTLEFKLLHFLASNPRRIFSRDRLLDEVWGRDRFVTPRTVDVHMRRLREKIESHADKPLYLQTVRGAGYRFSGQPQQ